MPGVGYGYQGKATRRMRVTFAWNNMAVAELRDLNRHRTGHRYTPMIQAGFYLPPEIPHAAHAKLLRDAAEEAGAEIYQPAEVTGLSRESGGFRCLLDDGGIIVARNVIA